MTRADDVRVPRGRTSKLVVAGCVFVAVLFSVTAIGYGYGDGDLWWQRQLGEAVLRTHSLPTTLGPATFSAPQARWIPHEWIFATVWALANRAGAQALFALGCSGVALLTIAVEAVRERSASPRARTFMLVLVAGALMPSFGLRAQVLAWPLLALLLLALESGPRRAWFAVPLSIVWYNLHASALIAPCIVLVDGLGRALDERRLSTLAGRLALAAVCALASLATPFGSALPRFTVAWSSNPATSLIYEWAPVAPDKLLIVTGVFVIAAILIGGELRGARLSWSQRFLALGLFGATMLHIRNLGPFAIVTGPWVANALMVLLPSTATVRRLGWRGDRGLAVIALASAIGLIVLRVCLPVNSGPAGTAVAKLTALHLPLRVACEDFSWCSRFAADTQVRVLLDGRTDAYPTAVFADYRRFMRGDALEVFNRWHIDAAIVHAGGPAARALRAAHWTLLRSGEPQVYLRRVVAPEQAKFERPRGVLAG